MSVTLIAIRLGLSAIFGFAGAAKLLDRQGTRDAVMDFEVPARFAGFISLLLPLFELALAGGLLLRRSAWWSALAALILLGAFTVLIGFNLQRGRAPECHCFGQLYSRPLGWPTLMRNIALAICTGFVVWQGPHDVGPSVVMLLQGLTGSQNLWVVGGFCFAALFSEGIILIHLLEQNRKLTSRVAGLEERLDASPEHRMSASSQGLALGSIAPAFELPTFEGGSTSLQQLLNNGKPAMLIFTNPKCAPCTAIAREAGEWQRVHSEEITIALISQGTIKDNFVNAARYRLQNLLLQQERETATAYQANATPTAVVVRPDGTIGSSSAAGVDEIRTLIQNTIKGYGRPRATESSALTTSAGDYEVGHGKPPPPVGEYSN